MAPFEVTVLGNNSSYPANGRFPTSQVLNYNNRLYLIDCGEGAQVRMSEYGIKRSRIDHIFISHLHGDHVFGLPGFINSFMHFSRSQPLHVYGPKGIRQLIETILRLGDSHIGFDLEFHEIERQSKHKILEEYNLRVYAFPLKHRVPTWGYLFVENEPVPNVDKEAIEKYGLSVGQIVALKDRRVTPATMGLPDTVLIETTPRSYAFCSDTVFDKDIVPWIKGADLLYHEATFMHDLEEKAEETKHSTAFQAGMIARLADVGELLIGHFSSRYKDIQPLLEEALEVFPDTRLALEGETFRIG